MKITVEKLPQSEVKITVETESEKELEFRDLTIKKLNQEVSIPGFRPGHIPENILEQKLGKELFQSEITNVAISQTYADAVIEKKLQVVSRPNIKILSKDPIKYEATVAVFPEIKVGDYTKIAIPKVEQIVGSDEINEIKKNVQEVNKSYKKVQREAKKGDRVEIDFQGFDQKGEKMDKAHSKNHPIILGNHTFLPEFETELEGLKEGQEKEFNVTFPADFHHQPFRQKTIHFKVKVNQVEDVSIPDLTEELVANYCEKYLDKKMSLKEFEEFIQERLLSKKKEEEKVRRQEKLLGQLIKITEAELPSAMIDEESEIIQEHDQNEYKKQGINYDKIIQMHKKQGKDYHEEVKKKARENILLRYAIRTVIEKEKISVTKNDLNDEKKHFSDNLSYKKEEIEAIFNNNESKKVVENNILMRKFYNFFLEKNR